jgi:hypothetical protein
MPAFGGGLTWSAHVVRWGTRTTPLGVSNLTLPGSEHTGLELVQALLSRKREFEATASAASCPTPRTRWVGVGARA